MNRDGILLRILSVLNIRKEEVRKVLLFTLLQGLIGLVIGLLSGSIDAWFIQRGILPVEDLLYRYLAGFLPRQNHGSSALAAIPYIQSAGALVMMGLGFLYASLSDRRNKQQLFRKVILSGVFLLLGAFGLCLADQYLKPVPFLAAVLFALRFPAGVFLTLLFWDAAGSFFDRRQGRRVFGMILLGSAAGYAVGSASAGALSLLLPAYFAFLPAALCAAGSVALLTRIRTLYVPVESPVYKTGFSAGEVFEGLSDFLTTPVLRTILIATFIFGLLSGLVMFTWSRTVTAKFGDSAGGIMAFVRSMSTILEAVIISRIISQPPLGRRMKYGWLVQWGFLVLGIVAFLISMVGTADFTRQISSTLLSPAAIILFSAVNSRKRGRSITINTLILAPAGMALAPLVLLLLKNGGILAWLYPLMLVLLILRILLTGQANRQYQRSVIKKASVRKYGLSCALQETLDAALSDEASLTAFMERLRKESPRFREAVWQILSGTVKNAAAWRILKNYRPEETSPSLEGYLILALEMEGEARLPECDSFIGSRTLVKAESLLSEVIARFMISDRKEADRRLGILWIKLLREREIPQPHRKAVLRILARFFRPEWHDRLSLLWKDVTLRESLLDAAGLYPSQDFDPYLYTSLEDPELRSKAAEFLSRRPALDMARLEPLLQKAHDPGLMTLVYRLVAREGREGGRKLLLEEFRRLTEKFFTDRDGMGSETGQPVYPGDGVLLFQLYHCMEALLLDPGYLPAEFRKMAGELADAAENSASALLSAWSRKRPGVFPLKPLVERMVNEDLVLFSRLQFISALMESFRPADLPLVRSLLEQLDQEKGKAFSGVPEAAVVLVSAKRYRFLSALSDTMTPEERLTRLRGWIRDPYFGFDDLKELWKRSVPLWHSEIRRKLVEAL